jgi:hypothetical protein
MGRQAPASAAATCSSNPTVADDAEAVPPTGRRAHAASRGARLWLLVARRDNRNRRGCRPDRHGIADPGGRRPRSAGSGDLGHDQSPERTARRRETARAAPQGRSVRRCIRNGGSGCSSKGSDRHRAGGWLTRTAGRAMPFLARHSVASARFVSSREPRVYSHSARVAQIHRTHEPMSDEGTGGSSR